MKDSNPCLSVLVGISWQEVAPPIDVSPPIHIVHSLGPPPTIPGTPGASVLKEYIPNLPSKCKK